MISKNLKNENNQEEVKNEMLDDFNLKNENNQEVKNNRKIPSWVKIESLQRFVDKINCNKIDEILIGVQAVRFLLSVENNPPIEEVFATNIVSKLLVIIEKEIPKDNCKSSKIVEQMLKLQFECACKFK